MLESFLLPRDQYVEWTRRNNENLMKLFNLSDWFHVFSDVTNVDQFENFMNMDCGQCYIAYSLCSKMPFAFVYLYMEDCKHKIVSIHGGGWQQGNSMMNYHAYVIFIDALLKQGYKVRTACDLYNVRAIRFNKSIGFINHYSTTNYRYFWISENRLHSSKIYNRVVGIEKPIINT